MKIVSESKTLNEKQNMLIRFEQEVEVKHEFVGILLLLENINSPGKYVHRR